MQVCKVCGGTVGYVNGQLAKCEYCGRVYSLNGDTLSEANLEEIYNKAVLLSKSEKESDQLAAINIWEAIGSYKDSGIKIQECRNLVSKARIAAEDKRLADLRQAELDEIERKKRENIEKQKKKIIYITAGIMAVVVVLGIAITTISSSMKKSKYEEAVALYESKQYEEAVILFEELDNYSDSGKYVENAKKSITERENTYKKGIGFFDAGMYSNAINELLTIADYLDAQEYIQKSATNLYKQAVADYEAENYDGAKEKLMMLPQNCNEYIQGNTLVTEIDEILLAKQKQESYNQALVSYESGEYETAQHLFVELGDYEDSKEYLETIGTFFYEQAKKQYDEGNYVECGKQLEYIDSVEEWKEYALAVELQQNAAVTYQNIIREEAKKICRNEGYSSMAIYVDGLICNILSAETAELLKEECTIEVIWLHEMNALIGDSDEFWDTCSTIDNEGNSYRYELFCAGGSYSNEITYALDEKFTILSGNLGLRNSDNDKKNGIWIEFYGDGRLLEESVRFVAGTRPYTFNIDVTGVTDLMIKTNSTSIHNWGSLLTDGFKVSE